jgi:hypothetical protein
MNSPQAPRFQFYVTKRLFEGRSVLTWARDQWDKISGQEKQQVLIDVTATPMSGVAADAPVLACVAEQYVSADGQISIYRYDAADGSTPFNKDSYKVWRGERLKNIPNLDELAIACGTCADANLYKFLGEKVFIVKEEPGDDHWLSKLPESVKVLIDQK